MKTEDEIRGLYGAATYLFGEALVRALEAPEEPWKALYTDMQTYLADHEDPDADRFDDPIFPV